MLRSLVGELDCIRVVPNWKNIPLNDIIILTMKKSFSVFIVISVLFLGIYLKNISGRVVPVEYEGHPVPLALPEIREIVELVKDGESLYDIFKKYDLDIGTLYKITGASRQLYDLVRLRPNRSYIITTVRNDDGVERLNLFKYSINDSSYLKIIRNGEAYIPKVEKVGYERRPVLLEGKITDNLINAVGETPEQMKVAFNLAEVFEADIDFLTELRYGDGYRMIVEELWLNGVFKGYGDILAAEFTNNGKMYEAYRFKVNGRTAYYDSSGRSMKKALLRAPLRFRYISSRFSHRRKHPILKIYRPHLGIDYAAPQGTPVSSAGNGTVKLAGWKGAYGKCVIIRHPNGYVTYYGHLSRIRKGIRRGRKVSQGEIIGYVGKTGLATGPHLDYRIKKFGKFVNPLRLRLPRGIPVPKKRINEFRDYVEGLRAMIAPPAKGENSLKADAAQRTAHSLN
ncbi:MAG TPA: M23 family metallopeptidase [Nitrospirae bacterium]|nr:M23 family metallopeptidase [Nitrospirota bacterium]